MNHSEYEEENDECDLVISGYSIEKEIGRGAMGVVYKATSETPHREVALKILLDGRVADNFSMERFKREIAFLAKLDHPNIYPIYDAGESNNLLFYTTKLMASSLSDILDETQLNESHTHTEKQGRQKHLANLILKITKAVAYAHEHGVIHRDIKPGNILFDSRGETYLADFGIALSQDSSSDFKLTKTGLLAGSLPYVSPEQIDGKLVTTQVDIYSIGVVLFEMITGKPPFHETSLPILIEKIKNQLPSFPKEIRIDQDLEAITLKCLSKKPTNRYLSAQNLASDLDAFINGKPVKARRPTYYQEIKHWAVRNPALVALNSIILISLLALVLSLVKGYDAEVARNKLQHEILSQSIKNERSALRKLAIESVRKADRIAREQGTNASQPYWDEALNNSEIFPHIKNSVTRSLNAWDQSKPIELSSTKHKSSNFCAINGNQVVTWGGTNEYSIYSLESPTKERLSRSVKGKILTINFAQTENQLLIVTDQCLMIHELDKGTLIHQVKLPSNEGREAKLAQSIHFTGVSQDEGICYVLVNRDRLISWDLTSKQTTLTQLKNKAESRFRVSSQTNNDRIYIAFHHYLYVINAKSNYLITRIELPCESTCSSISLDSKLLVVGLENGQALTMETDTLKYDYQKLHLTEITKLVFVATTKGTEALLTSSRDRSSKVFKHHTRLLWKRENIYRHPKAVRSLFPLSRNRLLTFCDDGFYRIYRYDAPNPIRTTHSQILLPSKLVCFNGKTGYKLVSADYLAKLQVFTLGKTVNTVVTKDVHINQMGFSSKQSTLFSLGRLGPKQTGEEGEPCIVSSLDNKVTKLEAGSKYNTLNLSPCSNFYSYSTTAGEIVVRDTKTNEISLRLPTSSQRILSTSVYLRQNGKLEVTWTNANRAFNIYSITDQSMRLTHTLTKVSELVQASPDGQFLALSTFNKLIILKTNDLKFSEHFNSAHHQDTICCISFSPDCKTIATGGFDARTRVWDLNTGKQKGDDIPHNGYVWAIAFHPHESIIAVGGMSKTIKIWDLTTNTQIGPNIHNRAQSTALHLSIKGLLTIGATNNNIKQHQLDFIKF